MFCSRYTTHGAGAADESRSSSLKSHILTLPFVDPLIQKRKIFAEVSRLVALEKKDDRVNEN
jgi:hypothetical protein